MILPCRKTRGIHEAQYVVQRVHHVDAASTHVLLPIDPWDQPWSAFGWWTGTRNCCRGWSLIETSGHVPGHQSVLVRPAQNGAILLPIDAVPFGEGFTRDEQDDGSNPDAEDRSAPVRLNCLIWSNGSISGW